MARRAIIVHSLEQARAALAAAAELGVPVTLVSAPAAAGYLGALAFREMIAEARRGYGSVDLEAILDCGPDPGYVLSALRQGLAAVRFTGPPKTAAVLAEIAAAHGARLLTGPLPACDLAAERDPPAACRRWLAAADRP
ncbi:MAG TPA: class II fructose-bisphosphate aldolase [Kiloniellales bacterium]|nr:class II fructose-bisphosphate aldolase [Kiloniellales bacterium]